MEILEEERTGSSNLPAPNLSPTSLIADGYEASSVVALEGSETQENSPSSLYQRSEGGRLLAAVAVWLKLSMHRGGLEFNSVLQCQPPQFFNHDPNRPLSSKKL